MRVLVAAISALAITGCATQGLSRSNGEYAEKLALSSQAQTFLADHTAKPVGTSPTDALLIYLAQQTPDPAERRRAVADATARALMMNSDLVCERYMAGVVKQVRTQKSVLGIAGLGLSGAAGVTTPVESANLLSALSTFATASDAKLASTVLSDKAPELVYKAVMAKRAEERQRLLALLENTVLGEAAPGVVMAQLGDYHNRCGPTVGINALEDSVQAEAERAVAKGTAQANAFVDDAKAQK